MARITALNDARSATPNASRFNGADAGYRGRSFEKAERFLMFREGTSSQILEFWVNPSECQWRVGTRTTIEKIQGGAVHHEWPQTGVGSQPGGILLDQPVLSLSFQSGSLLPEATNETSGTRKIIPPGIGNFYDFLSILNQPNILQGKPNYVNIAYYSSIMPEILLQGHFTEEGISWTDTADSPGQIMSWGASFMVFKSDPPLYDKKRMMDVFTSMFSRS